MHTFAVLLNSHKTQTAAEEDEEPSAGEDKEPSAEEDKEPNKEEVVQIIDLTSSPSGNE